jgi:thiol-disulfide isomerase/thioredoxin
VTPTKTKQAPTRPASSSRLFAIVVLAVAVLFVVAIVLTRRASTTDETSGGSAPGAALETAAVEITGKALVPFPGNDKQDPSIGAPAPALEGRSFDGERISFKPGGRPTAVLFITHWCPHCQREVPALTPWIDDGGVPDGVELFSVSTSVSQEAPNYPPSAWLEREHWPVAVIADDANSAAARAYGLTAYPYFVLIDSDGRVARRFSGEIPPETLGRVLRALR